MENNKMKIIKNIVVPTIIIIVAIALGAIIGRLILDSII